MMTRVRVRISRSAWQFHSNEDMDDPVLGMWDEFFDTIEGAIEYLKECESG